MLAAKPEYQNKKVQQQRNQNQYAKVAALLKSFPLAMEAMESIKIAFPASVINHLE